MADDLPVIRIVDTLLKHAILQDASDIHIEQMEMEVVVRYRIDGMLHEAMILPKNVGSSITARIKVLSSLKLDEKRLPQDGRFKIELSEIKEVTAGNGDGIKRSWCEVGEGCERLGGLRWLALFRADLSGKTRLSGHG